MDNDIDQARKDALIFLQHHKTGVLATELDGNHIHASFLYYTAEEFNIYFLTLANTRKFRALQANPRVAFTVSSVDIPQTLQIEGIATDISLDEETAKKRAALFEVLNANKWFYAPLSRLDVADVVVIWIRPTWIRWADYAFTEAGSDHVFKEIPVQ